MGNEQLYNNKRKLVTKYSDTYQEKYKKYKKDIKYRVKTYGNYHNEIAERLNKSVFQYIHSGDLELYILILSEYSTLDKMTKEKFINLLILDKNRIIISYVQSSIHKIDATDHPNNYIPLQIDNIIRQANNISKQYDLLKDLFNELKIINLF